MPRPKKSGVKSARAGSCRTAKQESLNQFHPSVVAENMTKSLDINVEPEDPLPPASVSEPSNPAQTIFDEAPPQTSASPLLLEQPRSLASLDSSSSNPCAAAEDAICASPQTGQCAAAEPTEASFCPNLEPEWVAEEARVAAENEREAAQLRREVELRNQHEEREARFKRLLRLLNTSQFYVKYLVDKIDDQHEKLKETLEKRKAKAKKRPRPEDAAEGVRRSARGANKENSAEQPPAKRIAKDGRRRGLPRKPKLASPHSGTQDDSQSEQDSKPSSQSDSQPEGTQGSAAVAADDEAQPRLVTGGTLRDYQLEGYNWLKVMFENGVNCILGDEMGLGKTIQCISLIAYLVQQSVVGPFLVAAPLSTLPNWLSEFERFCPDIPVVLYHGSQESRQALIPKIAKFHRVADCPVPVHPVVLTSYELVMRDSHQLSRFQWRYLIVDEGHRIKNHQCRLVRELKRYSSVNRLLLTGTPLQNNLAELWSLLNFLLPEIFDDLAVFESWFDVSHMTTDEDDAKIVAQERETQVVSTLHKILTPFLLRRVKRDVDLQIPPKRELLVYCPLVEDQEKLYQAAVDKTIAKLMGQRLGEDPDKPPELNAAGRPKRACKENISFEFLFSDGKDVLKDEACWKAGLELLEEARAAATAPKKEKKIAVHLPMHQTMMVMRHVVNHPFLVEHPIDPVTKQYLLVPELGEKSGKMMVLDAMLKRLRAAGHKVLIFSQFRMMLDILADFLTVKGHEFLRLDGGDAIEARRENIATFNSDPSIGVFIISTRAGGLGINLTSADTVIIYDSDWNPQCDLQAQDRAHRIGQTKPVVVYRLVTGGTIDEKIVERAAAKRKLEKMVMHSGKFKSGRREQVSTSLAPVTPDELLQLLRERQHHRVVRAGGQVFTDEEMDQLLDRSDMMETWAGQKKVIKKVAAGVFKELEDAQSLL